MNVTPVVMEHGSKTMNGRPIETGLYPHPIDTFVRPIIYREQCLRKFSAAFREEENWTEKLEDRSFVVGKLRDAASVDCSLLGERIHVWNKEDIDLVYEELREGYKPYVEKCKQNGLQPDLDGIWRIDDFADEGLRQDLIQAAATLENDAGVTWHSMNRQLLDLVHPCDFPIVYGESKTSDGETIQPPKHRETSSDDAIEYYPPETHYSERFCWLPSEFEISKKGKTKIASYVNNLAMPHHKETFYPILEKIFSKFVPMFNHVLADLRRETHELRRVEYQEYREQQISKSGKTVTEDTYRKTREKLFLQFERGEKLTADVRSEPQSTGEKLRQFIPFSFKRVESDLFGGGSPNLIWQPPPESLLQKVQLEGTTAKIIVKMATLILTPEKPQTSGGPWHVEALKNERIIAGGIYYYDEENITPSSLGLRRGVRDMTANSEAECQGLSGIFNTRRQEYSRAAQELGCIATKKNRAIVFPNICQHRTEPLELVDPTRNGYRRILAFFLCDPSGLHEIPTTRTVPAQQPEVREIAIKAFRETGETDTPFRLLEVTKAFPSTMTREENEKYRRELIEERTAKLTGIIDGRSRNKR